MSRGPYGPWKGSGPWSARWTTRTWWCCPSTYVIRPLRRWSGPWGSSPSNGKGTRDRRPWWRSPTAGSSRRSRTAAALDICRLFARDAGFEWRGGLALGGGPPSTGRPLLSWDEVARNARRVPGAVGGGPGRGQGPAAGSDRGHGQEEPAPMALHMLFGNHRLETTGQEERRSGRCFDRPFTEEEGRG